MFWELTFDKVKKEHIILYNNLYALKAKHKAGRNDLKIKVRDIIHDMTKLFNEQSIDLKDKEIDFITERLKFWKKLQVKMKLA